MFIEFVCRPEFLWAWMGVALMVLVLLTRISAPYGRHVRTGWGPGMSARWGWLLMEIVSAAAFAACFMAGERATVLDLVFLVLFVGHYTYRSLIYPFLVPANAMRIPLSIVAMAVCFNLVNGSVNGGWLYLQGPSLEATPWSEPRILIGLTLFVVGFYTHCRSDHILRNLRAVHGPGYHIPRSFLFRFVSCPNYLGEILQWTGWAVAMNSLAGTSFAVWTVANLLPRALSHHRWYRERFDEYPSQRKAVLPFLL
jgi:hypothetical protein